tara:strand:+ start:361 stop:1464 length:1104 start_codon:yes stop_codon:yes gene_type:complete
MKENLIKMLTPPGNGVFTVHTAADVISSVQASIYETESQADIKKSWDKSLERIEKSESPILLGICSDSGGGIHRGANWGPLFVRKYMHQFKMAPKHLDIGDIKVIPHLLHDKYLNEETISECRNALYSDSKIDLPVSPLSIAKKVCDEINSLENPPSIFSLGGDHSVSYPLVKSWLELKKRQNKKVAIVHFDAHTDLLDKRQGVDLCFATWAYHILNDLADPSLLVQLGIRSSGKPKEFWEKNLGVKQYWGDEIRTATIPKISREIINHFQEQHVEEIYISVDIDALDEQYASATGTPEENGLSPEMPIRILEPILEEFKATGADLVEVAPWVHRENDDERRTSSGHVETLLSASSISNFLISNLES